MTNAVELPPITRIQVCTRCWFKFADTTPPAQNWHLGQSATYHLEDGALYLTPHALICRALEALVAADLDD